MKKLAALVLVGLVSGLLTACSHADDPDQKWLATVEKIVQGGQTRVSTSRAQQVELLKSWATRHGFAVGVTKTKAGYRVELIKAGELERRPERPTASSKARTASR